MKKILIEVSPGELLDKISILEIKSKKILDKESLNFINKELKHLLEIKHKVLDANIDKDKSISILNNYEKLKNINEQLWLIEDKKRLFEKNSDFGENFIKISRDVHFLNDERASIKLNINKISEFDLREIKQYTKYQ